MKKTELKKKIANALIKHELNEWPPTCFGFVYQPKRPEKPSTILQKKYN